MSDNLPALPYPAAEATMDLCADHQGPVEAMQYLPEGTLLFTADQLRAAVAAERARCAAIADGAQRLPNDGKTFADGWCSASLQIAQAIRAAREP